MSLPVAAPAALAAPQAASALWFLDRATGVVTLVLLTAVLVLGVLTRGGTAPGRLPRFVVAGAHRNIALLTVALLGVHVATSVLDAYAPIRLVDAVVPFVSAYRPVWLGLGALALDLLAAVVVTSLVRARMRRPLWRGIHLTTYAAWPVALLHGLGTGSDVHERWMLMLTAACVVAVVGALLWRLFGLGALAPGARLAAGVAVVVAPVLLAVWVLAGPLAPGWAARSGTPVALLAGGASTAGSAGTGTPAGTASGGGSTSRPTGTAQLVGSVGTAGGNDDVATVVLDGTLQGGPGGRLRIELHGRPAESGGVALTDGTVTLTPADGSRWTGGVDRLSGGSVRARLHGPAGVVALRADLVVSPDQQTVQGTVTVG